MKHEHELPMLAGIAALLAWLESLAVIVSGPLLTVGVGIALVDLLTDGALLTSAPCLLYAWAIAQAIGVDAQLVGASFRMVRSARAGHPWAAVAYGVLVLVLGYVAYVAAAVFAQQQADGITTAQALSQLGMDSSTWLLQRVGISVVLVILSGALRYTPPAKAKVSAEHERAELERELELEPLRQRLRAQRTVGVAALARQALSAASGREPADVPVASAERDAGRSQSKPTRPPTGPGSPVVAAEPPVRTPSRPRRPAVLRLADPDPRPRRRAAASNRANSSSTKGVRTPRDMDAAERAARAPWAAGAHSVGEIEEQAGIARSVAGKYRRIFLAGESAQQQGGMAQ